MFYQSSEGEGSNNTEPVIRLVREMEDMTTKYPFDEQVNKNGEVKSHSWE